MNNKAWYEISTQLQSSGAKLVAVSKTKSIEEILSLYNQGQRVFGENKVQELVEKQAALPKDIEWHLIGHLQTNKVKHIAPFASMIHSIDSLKLLVEVNKQAAKANRIIPCLLQVYIAQEETKFGLDEVELIALLANEDFKQMHNIAICGLMGMASNTENAQQIHAEFASLKMLFDKLKHNYFKNKSEFKEISMGMSSDYLIALQHGSTLVRIGSALFGKR